nr:GH30 Xylanase [uncultured bacterium]AWD75442.1 xylanase [uncultured bacterium]
MFTKRITILVATLLILATMLFNSIAPANAAGSVTVNLAAPKQTIRGFGGMNHTTWISDLTDAQRTTAFGNGAGQIGMSILRIHVDESSSNWSREIATAQRAIALGAIVFASPWNPPASMTEVVNGQKRLRYDQYGAYVNHLNSFSSYMQQNGAGLYAISVQNEPDYAHDWTGWTSTEMLNFMKNNAGNIQGRVIAPESFQYIKSMSDPILNDAQALANMDILGAHLYGTPLSNFPYPLFDQKGAGKERWMTEVYTDSTTDANSWPNALEVAYNIHNSMVEAQFNAYVTWYIRRSYGMITENGAVSKRGYSMAQYSKFVRPGYVRVDATKNPTTNVYVSAYTNNQNVVVVVVNRNTSAQSVTLSISGGTVSSLTKYTTSGSKSVANDGTVSNSGGTFTLNLDASSATTFVGTIGGTVATATPTVAASPTRTNTPTVGPSMTPTRTNTPGTGPTNTPAASTATPTSGSGGTCSPVSSTITAPFSYDGAGTFCWQSTNLGSYINSWNTNSVTLNGVNVSNLYVASGSYPAKIGGFYYIAYNSSVAWGHFEAK